MMKTHTRLIVTFIYLLGILLVNLVISRITHNPFEWSFPTLIFSLLFFGVCIWYIWFSREEETPSVERFLYEFSYISRKGNKTFYFFVVASCEEKAFDLIYHHSGFSKDKMNFIQKIPVTLQVEEGVIESMDTMNFRQTI